MKSTFLTPPPQPSEQKSGQLTSAQVQEFFDEGVLLIEDFFDTETELEPIKSAINASVDQLAQKLLAAGKISNSYADADFFSRLTLINAEYPGATVLLHRFGLTTEPFRHIWANDRVLNFVEQLVGPNIAGHAVWNLRPKTPKTENHDVPWHQDQGYLDAIGDQTLQVTAWIPLLDTNETNGCLQLIPRGHKTGKVGPHKGCWQDTWYIYMDDEDVRDLDVDPIKDVVTYPVKYGSLLIFNNLVPHRSLPNLSDKIRWSLDMRWHDADKPTGFLAKESVLLRRADQPGLIPDFDKFDAVDRNEVTMKAIASEFDPVINPELWMGRWPLVHENKHTAIWTR